MHDGRANPCGQTQTCAIFAILRDLRSDMINYIISLETQEYAHDIAQKQ